MAEKGSGRVVRHGHKNEARERGGGGERSRDFERCDREKLM